MEECIMYRLGIDTGGTNTDVVLTDVDTGRMYYAKTPTTPKALMDGIMNGINKIVKASGLRNEEDYLITETGARRLGKKIPLTAEEVEAMR